MHELPSYHNHLLKGLLSSICIKPDVKKEEEVIIAQ